MEFFEQYTEFRAIQYIFAYGIPYVLCLVKQKSGLHLDMSSLQRPELHLDLSGQQEFELRLDVSTPQGLELHQDVSAQ
jgi:hypothetical protein